MRALARSLALLLFVAAAWAQMPPGSGPGRAACGPGAIGCGPATANAPTTSSTTTTTLPGGAVVPMAGGADVNCPTTLQPWTGVLANNNNFATWGSTCATGANAHGYDVTAVSLWVGNAPAGDKVKCSVYDTATPRNHLAAGCDTVEATLTLNPTGYVTMATTGACHLATATRYTIACNNNDTNVQYGVSSSTCTACWNWSTMPYANPWPATLTSEGNYSTGSAMFYLTATATP